jgi:hypothetical protein
MCCTLPSGLLLSSVVNPKTGYLVLVNAKEEGTNRLSSRFYIEPSQAEMAKQLLAPYILAAPA